MPPLVGGGGGDARVPLMRRARGEAPYDGCDGVVRLPSSRRDGRRFDCDGGRRALDDAGGGGRGDMGGGGGAQLVERPSLGWHS